MRGRGALGDPTTTEAGCTATSKMVLPPIPPRPQQNVDACTRWHFFCQGVSHFFFKSCWRLNQDMRTVDQSPVLLTRWYMAVLMIDSSANQGCRFGFLLHLYTSL